VRELDGHGVREIQVRLLDHVRAGLLLGDSRIEDGCHR